MIKHELNLSGITPFNRMQIEHLVHLAGKFTSRILFEHNNRTINGKSMLGLLSMGVTGEDPVTMVVEGEDEAAAAQEIRRLLEHGVTPPKSAADADALMQEIKNRYTEILHDNLVGIYLHGSLVAGCFQWELSDIDFLVVVEKPLEVKEKIALVEVLYSLREDAPPAGFEMSVMLAEDCKKCKFPLPYDLHFSFAYIREYERDARGFCERMHGEDPDLTAHVQALHAYGAALLGPGIIRTFAKPRREDVLAALQFDWMGAADHLHEKPIYYVLNLCRALAYLREELTLSKKDGGEWAISHLDKAHQAVIQAAINAYASGRDMFYDEGQAEDFCYDAIEELSK